MRGLITLLTPFFVLFMVSCDKNENHKLDSNETIQTTNKQAPKSNPLLRLQKVENNESKSSFTLIGLDEQNITLVYSSENLLTIKNIKQPLVLITLFSTWSPPCRAEFSVLSKIQKKYSNELLVVGLLVNDTISVNELNYMAKKYNATYFISAQKVTQELVALITKELGVQANHPIPLSILYKNGKFYRYYEGVMPFEMFDIEIHHAIE